METPYNKKDEWKIELHRVRGVVYMNVCNLGNTAPEKFMYWGYKFEEICTRAEGDAETVAVDANIEFCTVFKISIGDNNLVLGAEIDCKGEEEGHSGFVEIKTSREIQHPGQRRSFERFKLLKFWIQRQAAFRSSCVVVPVSALFVVSILPSHRLRVLKKCKWTFCPSCQI